jgi:hypothetical protein
LNDTSGFSALGLNNSTEKPVANSFVPKSLKQIIKAVSGVYKQAE